MISLVRHGAVADLLTEEEESGVPDNLLLIIIVTIGARVVGAAVAVTQAGEESTISLLGVLLVLLHEHRLAEVRLLFLVALVLALLLVGGVLAFLLVVLAGGVFS